MEWIYSFEAKIRANKGDQGYWWRFYSSSTSKGGLKSEFKDIESKNATLRDEIKL